MIHLVCINSFGYLLFIVSGSKKVAKSMSQGNNLKLFGKQFERAPKEVIQKGG